MWSQLGKIGLQLASNYVNKQGGDVGTPPISGSGGRPPSLLESLLLNRLKDEEETKEELPQRPDFLPFPAQQVVPGEEDLRNKEWAIRDPRF